MQDKDFLGYFGQLGPQSSNNELKQASANIVNTLLAVSTAVGKRRASVDEEEEKQLNALKAKYSTGDLGEGMTADLNYALKRLIRGLCSDNHAVKKGYFLASSQVLARFKKQIDAMKLLKFITEETKTSKIMKQPEIHSQTIAKLMCLSVIVESQLYQTSQSQINNDAFNKVASDLLQIRKDHEYCRESVQAVLVKVLKNITPTNHGAKLLERIATELIGDTKQFIFQHADNLSFYFALKQVYLERYVGLMKSEQEHFFKHNLLTAGSDNKNTYQKLCKILGQSTYLLPRQHSALTLIIEDIHRQPKESDKAKLLVELVQEVVHGYFCNDLVYQALKQTTRPKFLNIGISFTTMILSSCNKLS